MRRFVPMLSEVLPRPVNVLDVGARDGLQHPWDGLRPIIAPFLVEPDAEEARRLQESLQGDKGPPGGVLPYALWREAAGLTLHLTRSRGCSSVYRPNRAFLNEFPESERFDVEREVPVDAVTVDALAESGKLPTVDFAKIDVQGAELDILKGGRSAFAADLVGVEVEVEFCEMYEGQPLFGEVEAFVRANLGLELWDLRKSYWKHGAGVDAGGIKGRLIFGDALFLRPLHKLGDWFDALGSTAAREKAAMLVVGALAYGYADYGAAVLTAPATQGVLTGDLRAGLEKAVRSVGRGIRPLRHGSGALFMVLNALAWAIKPDYGGWATIGHSLGARRRGPFWT